MLTILKSNISFVVNMSFCFSTLGYTNFIDQIKPKSFVFRSLLFYSQSLPRMTYVLSQGHLDLIRKKKKKE